MAPNMPVKPFVMKTVTSPPDVQTGYTPCAIVVFAQTQFHEAEFNASMAEDKKSKPMWTVFESENDLDGIHINRGSRDYANRTSGENGVIVYRHDGFEEAADFMRIVCRLSHAQCRALHQRHQEHLGLACIEPATVHSEAQATLGRQFMVEHIAFHDKRQRLAQAHRKEKVARGAAAEWELQLAITEALFEDETAAREKHLQQVEEHRRKREAQDHHLEEFMVQLAAAEDMYGIGYNVCQYCGNLGCTNDGGNFSYPECMPGTV
ncbi:hypothetical protein C8R43DRAFT_1127195 [Mycena crocata]|nr:hypothetical protein C8R43DRAFT_1127195 [Mycena crocata]